jgi:DNA-binding beta-propeller fold protein YncE
MTLQDKPSTRRRRQSRSRRITAILAAVALTATGAGALEANAQPVGVGPLPIQFDLGDNQGKWFDTELNLFGTQSLAVAELPRVGLGDLGLDLSSITGGLGDIIGQDAEQIVNLPLGTGPSTAIGDLPVSTDKLLNLDQLRDAVDAAAGLDLFGTRTARANQLIDQFEKEVADRPVSEPIPLADLPVGVDLEDLLEDLQNELQTGLSMPVTAKFKIDPEQTQLHSVTGLIWPTGARGFPFDQDGATSGEITATLTEPGLYAFACKIHPYMLGAVVVDDPLTVGLDFGKKLSVNSRGLSVPSNADVIQQLVQKFFTITAPPNWQTFSATEEVTYDPVYPPAPILMYDAEENPVLVPSLDAYYQEKFNEPKTLAPANKKPATPGVGEVWIDTQMEQTAGKTKSGTATKLNVEDWTVDRKVALPQINLNNPHNMWTDKDAKVIYQTEWFSNRLTVFDRATGAYIRSIEVGPDPSHVMTRTDTGQLHVAINGGNAVMELSPDATKIDRRIPVQLPGEKPAHPHAHWMTGDGKTMITPNVNNYDATVVDIPTGTIRKESTGELPIASGMMPDGSKAYQANFLGQSVSCISLAGDACNDAGAKTHNKTIDLWANYDPESGAVKGDWGGLPIQIPVSPDGSAVLVANTLTGTITVIDPDTDQIVKTLPCDAGCHGINFGLKQGGGYYGYVSSKFSNTYEVIDPDPNGDGDPADATLVGKGLLVSGEGTATDDEITGYAGMGGQGVLPIPLVYNGWAQQTPLTAEFGKMTCAQRNPVSFKTAC